MIRIPLLSGALLATLCLFGGRDSCAQAPGSAANAEPVTQAPQPQKKQPAGSARSAGSAQHAGPGTQGSTDSSASTASAKSTTAPGTAGSTQANPGDGAPAPKTAADDNAFPEETSRRAARDTQSASQVPGSSSSKSALPAANPAGGANPFPEDISRQAAKAARDADRSNAPPLPPGVSSSQSSGIVDGSDSGLSAGGSNGGTLEVTNPSRASKDTQVGDFYLQREDAKGAYLRYQDAIHYDPTNVDAIFGIAEAARILGKPAEAMRNYQLYLDILPHGPKSKRALKQLHTLARGTPPSAR